MRSQWVIWLLVAGFAYVYGNPCDTTAATACYSDLVHYESLAFPLYGQNEAKLDDTCGNINMSFDCIHQYYETCHGTPECDDNCTELISDIVSFIKSSGVRKLESQLCSEDSAVREVYLENAMCLENNADLYASCHNDSQTSLHYLNTIMGAEGIQARCCYFTWYHDCFTNLTRDNCGENATFFVSFAVHKLIGDISEQLCYGVPSTCARPPLPTEDKLDKHKHDKTDNDIDNTIDEKSDNDIENTIDDKSDNKIGKPDEEPTGDASRIKSYVLNLIVLPYLYMLLSKYIL